MSGVTVWPQPQTAEPRRRSYMALAVLQVLDVGTTWWVLERLGGDETNPVARLLTDAGSWGLVALLLFKLWVVVRLYAAQTPAGIGSAVYGMVAVNNALALACYIAGPDFPLATLVADVGTTMRVLSPLVAVAALGSALVLCVVAGARLLVRGDRP